MGTVVHAYKHENNYEVEFTSIDGKTIAVLTLNNCDIRKIQSKEIMHARSYANK